LFSVEVFFSSRSIVTALTSRDCGSAGGIFSSTRFLAWL
jgi:hypothetical protein